jgi:FMN reductase (NADPH)
MIEAIQNHRSIRKFLPKPISDILLNEILSAGSRASTTGNMQVYSIIVTTQPELKKKLWEIHFKQNMVLEAPVILTLNADFNRFTRWCQLRHANPGYDNFLSFITASTDALLASQNIALEAENHGLGICYLGTTTYNADKIIDTLQLPKGVVPVTTLVLGYPAETPELTDRLPMNAIVHYETYHDYTPDQIDQLYAERESSEITSELLKINKKESLAQIFTENRYTRKDNVLFSKKYLEVIEKQGFMNNKD